MSKTKYVWIPLIAVVVIGSALFIMKKPQPTNMNNNAQTMDTMQESENVAPNTVVMKDLGFQQKELTVKKGTTVTWENHDTAKHNVIFDDSKIGKVEEGKLISRGEKLEYTFAETGTYAYHCQPHPFMKATIKVTD